MAVRLVFGFLAAFSMACDALELDPQTQALLEREWAEGSLWLFNGGPLSLTSAAVFPVITRTMQAKVLVTDRVLDTRPVRSICVVGDDDLSIEWLTTNRDYLTQAAAICLVVNVESQPRLIALQQISEVPLWPMAADQLSVELGLSHYPVLIDARVGRIRQ